MLYGTCCSFNTWVKIFLGIRKASYKRVGDARGPSTLYTWHSRIVLERKTYTHTHTDRKRERERD